MSQVELSAENVKAYLAANPDFFELEADFLSKIKLSHAERGSVSLVERQLERLRSQNEKSQTEMAELYEIARSNEAIYSSFCQMFLALLPCQTISDVRQKIQTLVCEILGLSSVEMLPLCGQKDWIPRSYPVHHDALHEILHRRLAGEKFYLGEISPYEQQCIFGAKTVSSAALMTIEDDSILLAFGSAEADHFHAELDTCLISQLKTIISAVIWQIRERSNG